MQDIHSLLFVGLMSRTVRTGAPRHRPFQNERIRSYYSESGPQGDVVTAKFRNVLIASIVVLLTAGCTSSILESKYIGERLPVPMLQQITPPSGHHFWKHKHLDIDYDYTIDGQAQTITFNGTIQYNRKPEESQYHSETVLFDIERCEFRLLFTDNNGEVIGVAVENIFPDKNIYETIPFNKTIPYKDTYEYMMFGYYMYTLMR